LATSPVLQGLIAQGRTIAETLEIAEDVARKLIESCVEHGDPLPIQLTRLTFGKKRHAKVSLSVPVPIET